jgi:phage baseplate assembly protein gpV/phage protein D
VSPQALQIAPGIAVRIDGTALADRFAARIEGLLVQQQLSMPTLCELTFAVSAGDHAEEVPIWPGASLRIDLQGELLPLFTGQVTAVEFVYQPSVGHEVRVRAYDALHALRKRQPIRAHVQVTLEALARELVADLGLSVQTENEGPSWTRLIQHAQSDLDLLTDVAARCGVHLTLRGTTLHLVTLEGIGEPVPLRVGESLLEARIEVNTDPACRSVNALAWDPSRVVTFQATAARARAGRGDLSEAAPDRLGAPGQRTLADEIATADDQVTAAAQAELDARVAREIVLRGLASGDQRLMPGARVALSGVSTPFPGGYVLTRAFHLIDRERGYVTEISSEPPPARPRARGAIAAFGIVTRIDDPEALGRVRVKLPTYGNLETEWMGVLTPGAGTGKGLVTMPDVGDQVLVLSVQGDPVSGVVLGGLYGLGAPPDSGLEEGVIARYTLVTPGRQRVQLDDARRILRVENSEGSFVELSPDGVTLHAAADLLIEAPGRRVVIQGQSIDFQRK